MEADGELERASEKEASGHEIVYTISGGGGNSSVVIDVAEVLKREQLFPVEKRAAG